MTMRGKAEKETGPSIASRRAIGYRRYARWRFAAADAFSPVELAATSFRPALASISPGRGLVSGCDWTWLRLDV